MGGSGHGGADVYGYPANGMVVLNAGDPNLASMVAQAVDATDDFATTYGEMGFETGFSYSDGAVNGAVIAGSVDQIQVSLGGLINSTGVNFNGSRSITGGGADSDTLNNVVDNWAKISQMWMVCSVLLATRRRMLALFWLMTPVLSVRRRVLRFGAILIR